MQSNNSFYRGPNHSNLLLCLGMDHCIWIGSFFLLVNGLPLPWYKWHFSLPSLFFQRSTPKIGTCLYICVQHILRPEKQCAPCVLVLKYTEQDLSRLKLKGEKVDGINKPRSIEMHLCSLSCQLWSTVFCLPWGNLLR